ncbi:hypothetical protein MKZ38_009324 [Zalerion maritima]|uniref:Uncharacterized protein n=1 Tax=Zalerion maritima TaxID=339359 RepID=A0AAD5WN81_9PEZI|nr:hypothetical protein MKZ38_009324 [Zalerion maritima]
MTREMHPRFGDDKRIRRYFEIVSFLATSEPLDQAFLPALRRLNHRNAPPLLLLLLTTPLVLGYPGNHESLHELESRATATELSPEQEPPEFTPTTGRDTYEILPTNASSRRPKVMFTAPALDTTKYKRQTCYVFHDAGPRRKVAPSVGGADGSILLAGTTELNRGESMIGGWKKSTSAGRLFTASAPPRASHQHGGFHLVRRHGGSRDVSEGPHIGTFVGREDSSTPEAEWEGTPNQRGLTFEVDRNVASAKKPMQTEHAEDQAVWDNWTRAKPSYPSRHQSAKSTQS